MFFSGPWNTNISKFKYLILGIFFIWTVIACIMAAQMGPLTEEEEFLPKDHPMSENTKILSERFAGGGSTALYIVMHFGILDLDKEGTSMWKSNDIGTAILDPEFDISSVEAQQSLLDLCSDLRS
jgi:uncharacterized membrane protein YdfJ with MMPL/SSD domain